MSRPGQFQPGQSGNPKGRIPGSGKVALWRGLLENKANELINAVISRAMDGDPVALRLCVERLVPAYRNESRDITLPGATEGTLSQRALAVITSIAQGEMEPRTGSELIAAIAQVGRVEEMEQVKVRLAALESAVGRS